MSLVHSGQGRAQDTRPGLSAQCPAPQPSQQDAAIVGAVRLLSVLIAAVTMDLAGRKVLLYVSGECLHCNVCLLSLQPLCPLQSLGHIQASQHMA